MVSDDDLTPAWPRDDGQIAADITAMEDFAAKLLADVDNDYAPHADTLANQMLARLPAADIQFNELTMFNGVLEVAQDTCQQNIYNFANGTHGFAKAAEQVSQLYRGSDAFARARLSDVDSALVTAGLLPPDQSSAGPASSLGGESSAAFDPSKPDTSGSPPSGSPPSAPPSSSGSPPSGSPSSGPASPDASPLSGPSVSSGSLSTSASSISPDSSAASASSSSSASSASSEKGTP